MDWLNIALLVKTILCKTICFWRFIWRYLPGLYTYSQEEKRNRFPSCIKDPSIADTWAFHVCWCTMHMIHDLAFPFCCENFEQIFWHQLRRTLIAPCLNYLKVTNSNAWVSTLKCEVSLVCWSNISTLSQNWDKRDFGWCWKQKNEKLCTWRNSSKFKCILFFF